MGGSGSPGPRISGTFLSTGATIKWSAEEEGLKFESEAPDETSRRLC
jgi:hypothetical protein